MTKDQEFELKVLNFAASRGFGRFVLELKNSQPKEQQSCDKRPWVSLTEEEKDSFLLPFGSYWVIDAIEAKLKEKNGV